LLQYLPWPVVVVVSTTASAALASLGKLLTSAVVLSHLLQRCTTGCSTASAPLAALYYRLHYSTLRHLQHCCCATASAAHAVAYLYAAAALYRYYLIGLLEPPKSTGYEPGLQHCWTRRPCASCCAQVLAYLQKATPSVAEGWLGKTVPLENAQPTPRRKPYRPVG
jgi:hypothetical protein